MRTMLTVIVALLALTAPVARAQPESAELERLRAENASLRQRVSELESALSDVRTQLSELLRSIATASIPSRAQPSIVAATPDPSSSPDALLALLRSRYQRELPIDARTPGAVRTWCDEQNTKRLGRVTWLIMPVADPPQASDPGSIWVRVHDELTGMPMGAAAELPLNARLVRTLGTDPVQPWLLGATLSPRVVFNPERPGAGVFNYPELIGPYAEFGLSLERPELRAAPEGTKALIEGATTPMPAAEPGR